MREAATGGAEDGTPSAAETDALRRSDLARFMLEEQRPRGVLVTGMLVPVSLLFVVTDLRLDVDDRIFYGVLRAGLALLLAATCLMLRRTSSPAVFQAWCLLVPMAVAASMALRFALGDGAVLQGATLAANILALATVFLLPLRPLLQALAAVAMTGAIALGIDFDAGASLDHYGAIAALLGANVLGAAFSWVLHRELVARHESLREVDALREILPICAWCRNVRDDDGLWRTMSEYVEAHQGVMLSHGICPSCSDQVEAMMETTGLPRDQAMQKMRRRHDDPR